MAIECPQQYSVWENDKGGKVFVEDVLVDDDLFFVTIVPYADRDDMNAIGDALDKEQWAEIIHDGLRQTGIEPPAKDR